MCYSVLRRYDMSETLTIRLPKPLRLELERMSREDGVPLSKLVRESLRRYVAMERFERVRALVRPYAEAAGYYSEEDILKIPS